MPPALSPELSIVIPVFNEEDVLPLLVQRLRPVADGLGATYEVVAVDDGSTDNSAVVLQRLRREWAELRIVRLATQLAAAAIERDLADRSARRRGLHTVEIEAEVNDHCKLGSRGAVLRAASLLAAVLEG